MKCKYLAIAVAMLTASSVQAQSSVTLYGVVDAGIEYLNHAVASTGTVAPGAKGHSLVALQSGNQSGSRWGLRGIEDLGGGLKSLFVLESGFSIDTGTSTQSGRLFGRGAYVGLENQWGRLTLGRHTVPFYDFAVTYDPMAISSRYSIGAQDPFMGAARADNSVKYMGTFGGLSVTGLYSFNYNNQEVPGNFTNGREYSLGANYSGGSFSIGAVYDQINQSAATALQTNSLTQRAAVAGTYAYGNAKVYAGYRYAHAFNGASLPGSTVANTASNLAWAGVGYQLTPALSFAGSAYYQNLRNSRSGNPWQFVMVADYALSKRTDLYTVASYVLNKGKSSLGVNGFNSQLGTTSEAVQPGANQFGAVVGVRHKF
ncbi:putative porin [Cupriavidus metallidurans]|jgi:predicted porin|uniref:porin n=1 Tax=Cupriavidus TaxID=106589 RepID=UPI000493A018|nr:porin [Cupriavidus metallidurans]KWW39303.1 Outer membrane porin protein [Cupriavidus metallidurans]MDE4920523.1 porin [Cupriavidus metallidurans]